MHALKSLVMYASVNLTCTCHLVIELVVYQV